MSDWYTVDGTGGLDVFVSDSRECGLPGVDCSTCGNTWAEAGVIYPTVDCRSLPERRSLLPGTVPPERFKELRQRLEAHFGDGRLLPPGTEFGPQTSAVKTVPPPVFMFMGCVFVQEVVADAIIRRGVRVSLASTAVRHARGKRRFALAEIEAPPVATLARPMPPGPSPCERCGYHDAPSYDRQPLASASVRGLHMACLRYPVGARVFVSAQLREILASFDEAAVLTYGEVSLE